jgi:hypothetical protein
LDPKYRSSQDGTLHFRYLIEAAGGLLQVANDLDEHVMQLGSALAESHHEGQARAFVGSFVRPHGVDRPATPILADALQGLATLRTRPERAPFWALVARVPLFVVALLARVAWTGLQSGRFLAWRVSGQRAGPATSAPKSAAQARSTAAATSVTDAVGSDVPRSALPQ